MINGWGHELQGHWIAMASFATKWWGSQALRAIIGAAAAAVFGSILTGHTLLAKLDTRMNALEAKLADSVAALNEKIQEKDSNGVKLRELINRSQDERIAEVLKRQEELRMRIRQLEGHGKKTL